ncbi:oligopeptide ABC transporter substrate-binding protein [Ornithinibacillus gellani]|uniref:oligopeptide ABC transporter substrate-binding protein n=1 Tax=Ornithinibacillus gellani TaxID=2293253 RepID=UPI000F4701DB|nr:oligopeptide ABC transporter substrate-binding protein [Ornithinibacillus gellani]TQS72066.1 oligopeptide ABC transporter substrate-binding protein [Ornithinibacillus gellani]
MNKKLWFLLVLLLSLVLALGACSSSSGDGDDKGKDDGKTEDTNKGDDGEAADGEPQEGGTLVYALDSAPDGVFNINFYGTATDAEVIGFFDDGLIKYDDELKPVPNIAEWETDDNKVFTFKFKEGVKWHNGEELTVDDWVFALETIAHPDYDASRYANVKNIEGAEAFHEGEADSISGLKVVNDYEIEITFDKARVNNLENLWTYPMSRKEFEGVEVADMSESEQVRTNPVGTGPFKVTKIVPGESIQFEAFEDYWQGKPHIDSIVLKVIDPSLVVEELRGGTLDMTAFHPSNYEEINALDNAEVLRAPGLSYYYVGFRLGSYDGKKATMDYEKYQNQDLRLAMAHAIDREAWIDEYFYGLGESLNRVVPSAHWIAADDADLENHFEFDPELAKQILEDAGYVDTDDDGFREDPDGNKFVVKFSHYATDNPDFEARAKALTQYWNDVGLETELEMTDSGLYYPLLEEGDDSMEVFFGGWSTGADPDPTALWQSDMVWNFPRWVDEENDQLMEDALDIEIVGTDQDKRKELYVEWQQNINEFIPMIPVAELEEVLAISSRLQNVTMDVSGTNSPHEWWIQQ